MDVNWFNNGAFWASIGALFVFGLAYSQLISWLRKNDHLDGYTAFVVVFGVLVTLTANKLFHHPNPVVDLVGELVAFGASGLPMIISSVWGHMQGVAADRQAMMREVGHGA